MQTLNTAQCLENQLRARNSFFVRVSYPSLIRYLNAVHGCVGFHVGFHRGCDANEAATQSRIVPPHTTSGRAVPLRHSTGRRVHTIALCTWVHSGDS